jgi:hypothetical protein
MKPANRTTTAAGAVSRASPVFERQFCANTTFAGTAKKTACDSAIDQKEPGHPRPRRRPAGLPVCRSAGPPAHNVGVRWSVTRDFGSGGPFAVTAATRDGIRVCLDGTREVDVRTNVSATRTSGRTSPATASTAA